MKQCEKDAHLSKLKEWTQRHVKYSESETLMAILQDQVPGEQRCQEAVTTNIILPNVQVPPPVLPPVPHWLSTMGCTFFS
jgi:hypothetical protein